MRVVLMVNPYGQILQTQSNWHMTFLWIIIHRYFNEYYTEKVLKFSFHKSGDFVYILQFLFFFQNCEFISHNDFATFISHNFES